MVKVTMNGKTIAESNDTIVVEGNHYFPPSSVNRDVFTDSKTHTHCGWKGDASYYNVDGQTDVAWYYPAPYPKAENIKNYVAFYKNKVNIQ